VTTEVSLRDYIDSRIESLDKRISESQTNSKEAIALATKAQDRRLDLLNEFRAQQQDEAVKYASRETLDNVVSQVSKIWGGLAVVALVGVANLVKLFLVHQ